MSKTLEVQAIEMQETELGKISHDSAQMIGYMITKLGADEDVFLALGNALNDAFKYGKEQGKK